VTRELTGSIYTVYFGLSFKLNLSKSRMSLTTLTRYWPDHTLESLSKLDVGALVLVTGLVSFYSQVHILALGLTKLVVVPGVPLVFSSL
jgi:hypothetical protein